MWNICEAGRTGMHPELKVRKRMLLLVAILGALFLLVALRLWQLTILEHD